MSYNFTDFIPSGTARTSYRFSAHVKARYRTRWLWRAIRVFDISREGIGFSRAVRLRVGQKIQIALPVIGKIDAEVRWLDGQTVGCAFKSPLDRVLLDAFVLYATTNDTTRDK